ncbi:hypothetical protein HGRIS_011551 [Hohenbuehelia grisea]|uniref:Transmembrane protein n=1 Tax=Hohenbuehelia grisea TaxID=104357 RepID=A0ABR3JVG6_9AGAR
MSSALSIILDNTHPTFNLSSAWTSVSENMWYNGTVSAFAEPQNNATIACDFLGKSISLFGQFDGPISASIDNEAHTFTTPEPNAHESQPLSSSTRLSSDGPHHVNVELSREARFDYATIEAGPETPLEGQNVIVDDGDESLQFSPEWLSVQGLARLNVTNGQQHRVYKDTIHQSTTPGANLVFQFTGTSVAVYGVVRWQNAGRSSSAYILDGSAPETHAIAASGVVTKCNNQPNYLFFQRDNLDPGNHTLAVTATEISGDQAFILDFVSYTASFANLSVNPNLTGGDAASWTAPPLVQVIAPRRRRRVSLVGAIVGAILGALVLITLVVAFLCIRRRQRRNRMVAPPPPGGHMPIYAK